MVLSTLEAIRQKVRRVTARLSADQMSNEEIDFYVNTFYLYDFPEHLRLQTLRRNYIFFTKPNIERYDFPTEMYVSNNAPIYVGGYQVGFYQDQSVFYALWPKINFAQIVATGDGVTVAPVLANLTSLPAIPESVSLSAIIGGESFSYLDDGNGVFRAEGTEITGITQAATAVITAPGHTVIVGDIVFLDGVLGMTQINGGPYNVTGVAGNAITINVNSTNFSAYQDRGVIQRQIGTVNYITGAITLNWGVAPDAGEVIRSSYIPYVASRPRDILFFHNQFLFRPIPDRAYKVDVVVQGVPTEILAESDAPEIRQWWQVLALGAALKIFEDNGDQEQYARFRPIFEEQLALTGRRTVKQQTSRRVVTPFADGLGTTSYGLFYDIFGS
jgi:hypothetical protein